LAIEIPENKEENQGFSPIYSRVTAQNLIGVVQVKNDRWSLPPPQPNELSGF